MIDALETILSRPKTVLTLMIVMVIAGILTYISIPKEANPDIDVPVYLININQRGVSPQDSERLLVKPMETQLRGIEGLKEFSAFASEGNATIVLEFQIGSNKEKILADIRDKVDQAKAQLPSDADEPGVFETNFALQPTMIVTLSGDLPERTLYEHARKLKDEIETISTVKSANLKGTREEQLEVVLDLLKLESYNISNEELVRAVTSYNQLVPAGFIDDGNARFNLKLPGLVESAQDVYSIPIKQNGEGVVTLGQVAEIRSNFKDASSYTRVNGQPAMSIEVVKRIGTNIIENNKEVRNIVEEFTKEWPSTIKINFMIDQSNFIFEVLGSLQSSIMTAISLVMIVVIAALGFRSGLLVGLAIPTSFMVGFLILASLGMTVNMMVMFGLVLTVGMLVDGAIVMIEYADRKMAEGLEPREAYNRAAKLMFWPIVSSTATTLAAFLPLLLWPGTAGEFMSYLPIMVIIVLTASLLTALVFVPVTGTFIAQSGAFLRTNIRFVYAFLAASLGGAIAFGFFKTQRFDALQGALREFKLTLENTSISNADALIEAEKVATSFGTNIALPVFLVLGAIAFWLLGKINLERSQSKEDEVVSENVRMLSAQAELKPKQMTGIIGLYVRFLNLVSNNLIGNAIVIASVIGITAATFITFGQNSAGVEFFVDEEPDVAIVFVQARGNLSGKDIRDLAIEVEHEILQTPGIDNVVLTATAPGGGGGGGGINLEAPQDTPADVVASMQIELVDFGERRKAAEIFKEIETRTANIPGIKVEVRKIEGGPPTGKDINLQITSTNYDDLLIQVKRVRDFVDTMEHLENVEDSRPLPGIEWQIDVNREEAGRYNAGIAQIGYMVQLVTNGVNIGKYRPDNSEDEVDIPVRLPESQRSLQSLQELRLRTPNGQVPITNFIDMKAQQKVTSITRRDGVYAMDIKAGVDQSVPFENRTLTPNDKIAELETWLDAQEWPSNLNFKFRGGDEDQEESGAFLGQAAAGALFLMFIILVTQYNSFYQTFLTLSTVILAVVGVLIGLMVTGQKFSIIMTGTGVVALAGIVVNNAIVLIDTYNRLRSEGVNVNQAVLKTSAQRLRPIMLTTITTIMGLIPMALQINMDYFERTISVGSITAIWWVQLSTAIIAGLTFSTLLTLVLTPVMLSLPENIARLFRKPTPSNAPQVTTDIIEGEVLGRTQSATKIGKAKQKKTKRVGKTSKLNKLGPAE
ncbi:MAG: efflux RND transporter permease subunit [Nitratireductor sp.]